MSSNPQSEPMVNRSFLMPSMPETLQDVESILDELNTELGIKPDAYGNMVVAVTEAVNNGIVHGNKLDPGKLVTLEIASISEFRLRIRVEDEGKGFDPYELDDPTAPENIEKVGGRGVFFMRSLSDKIEFLEGGRVVEMEFNI